jgi:hypothetical protein
VFLILVLGFYGGIIWLFSSPDCYYDEEHAKEKVVSFLLQSKVSNSKLELVNFNSDTCQADFNVTLGANTYSIIVINDFVKGAKVTGDLSEIIAHKT